jgi:protein ImuA
MSARNERSGTVSALRQILQAREKASLDLDAGSVPFGIGCIDATLGGGLPRGALHEIAAPHEPAISAATGFVLILAADHAPMSLPKDDQGGGVLSFPRRKTPAPPALGTDLVRTDRKDIVWIAEDMALLESGAPHGPGLDEFGIAPERLVTVAAAKPRDVLWAMEEALRCGAVGAVIGELRGDCVDLVATRRLSLAAAAHGALAFLLRTTPAVQASAATTRWVVGAARSLPRHGPGPPRFDVRLVRNRRGSLGSWVLELCRDQRFVLAPAHPEPVAQPAVDRPRPAGARQDNVPRFGAGGVQRAG